VATTQVIKDVTSLDFQAAWNDSVVGFLSKYGTLGQIEQLTAGIGIVQTDTSVNPNVSYVAVPSIRSVLTSVLQRTGDYADLGQGGITNQPFAPSPGPVASVASVSRAATPVAAAVAAAPATEAPAGDSTAVSAPAGAATAAASVDGGTVVRPVAGDDAGSTSSAAAPTAGESAAPSAASSAAAPKAGKHGVSRKAAKAAASSN
jgi:hypothetical protein